jgi:putative membrane protein
MGEVGAAAGLIGGTLLLRAYVFVFLSAYLILAVRDLGGRRALSFLVWGTALAFAAEFASTRVGIPFGLYQYTGATVGRELYLSNVPLFDPLSFPFLAYASWCLARWASGRAGGVAVTALTAALMLLLDVVIDPLAVRGERWFLGPLFVYPDGGAYFGVPLSNFFGWGVVGGVIIGGYLWWAGGSEPARGSPVPGVGLFYGVFLFNWTLTLWIGELRLAAVGFLLHGSLFLVLWGGFARRAVAWLDPPPGWRGEPRPRPPEGARTGS